MHDQRTVVKTGQVLTEKHPQGYIPYDKDGRMLVVILRDPRPKTKNADKITDKQSVALFRTMSAYSGTYEYDGSTVKHHIDLSWNEAWTGTTQIRSVHKDGNRLIYKTAPFRFFTDGKLSVGTLIWQKID